MTLHVTIGDCLAALAAWTALNTLVLLWLSITTKRFRMRVHGPRLDLSNPYVRRDIAEGGPLSGTGVVPSGSNVLPLRGSGRMKGRLDGFRNTTKSDDKEPVS